MARAPLSPVPPALPCRPRETPLEPNPGLPALVGARMGMQVAIPAEIAARRADEAALQQHRTQYERSESVPALAAARARPIAAVKPVPPGHQRVDVEVDFGPAPFENVLLEYAWERDAWDANGNMIYGRGQCVTLEKNGRGRYTLPLDLLEELRGKELHFDIKADTPAGKRLSIMLDEDFPARTTFDSNFKALRYDFLLFHKMGARPVANEKVYGHTHTSFRRWDPDAASVAVRILDEKGSVLERHELARNDDGTWSTLVPESWSRLKFLSYQYEVVNEHGEPLKLCGDEWSFGELGEGQTNLAHFYANPHSGEETNESGEATSGSTCERDTLIRLMRYDIQGEADAAAAYLFFDDADGNPLSEAALRERLGAPLPQGVAERITAQRMGVDEIGHHHIEQREGGAAIRLQKRGGAWETLVHNLEAQVGLHYRLVTYDRKEDGQLQPRVGRLHLFNAPNNEITWASGKDLRAPIIDYPEHIFAHARPKVGSNAATTQFERVTWGAAGQGARRPNYQEAGQSLRAYLRESGERRVQNLPTQATGTNRGWRYDAPNSYAKDPSGNYWRLVTPSTTVKGEVVQRYRARLQKWIPEVEKREAWIRERCERHERREPRWVQISATRAHMQLTDELHGDGVKVFEDEVYNHGRAQPRLWERGGWRNRYFNHAWDPTQWVDLREWVTKPMGKTPAVRHPWVSNYFLNSAAAQVLLYNADGLRFDLTNVLTDVAQDDGYRFLRRLNRMLHLLRAPEDLVTLPEHYPELPALGWPANRNADGMGFDWIWFNGLHRTRVKGDDKVGALFAAGLRARGYNTAPPDLEAVANVLRHHYGVEGWWKALVIGTDHDQRKVRGPDVRNARAHDRNRQLLPTTFELALTRASHALTLFFPGHLLHSAGAGFAAPHYGHDVASDDSDLSLLWQRVRDEVPIYEVNAGSERVDAYLALSGIDELDARIRDPRWTILSNADRKLVNLMATLDPQDRFGAIYGVHQAKFFEMHRAALALRASSHAFNAEVWAGEVHASNHDSTLRFLRTNGEAFLIVHSLNSDTLDHYQPGVDGTWQEVFNSESYLFGGSNIGNGGRTLHPGNPTIVLPGASTVVYQRMD